AIFMDETEADVNLKIKKAFCEPQNIENNPILKYCKYIILPRLGSLEIKRKPENGGDIVYTDYDKMKNHLKEGALHPGDLKPAVAKAINTILQPVRDHFKNNNEAARLQKLVKGYRVTK